MDISKLVTLKNKELYQQELDAIDKKYSLSPNSIGVKKEKFIEKSALYKKWSMDLREATDEADNILNKLKMMFDALKGYFQQIRTDFYLIRDDLHQIQAELESDDSGIDEMLATTAPAQDDIPNRLDHESLLVELSEEMDELSRELNDFSTTMGQLVQIKADITAQCIELQQKHDDFMAEMERELSTISSE